MLTLSQHIQKIDNCLKGLAEKIEILFSEDGSSMKAHQGYTEVKAIFIDEDKKQLNDLLNKRIKNKFDVLPQDQQLQNASLKYFFAISSGERFGDAREIEKKLTLGQKWAVLSRCSFARSIKYLNQLDELAYGDESVYLVKKMSEKIGLESIQNSLFYEVHLSLMLLLNYMPLRTVEQTEFYFNNLPPRYLDEKSMSKIIDVLTEHVQYQGSNLADMPFLRAKFTKESVKKNQKMFYDNAPEAFLDAAFENYKEGLKVAFINNNPEEAKMMKFLIDVGRCFTNSTAIRHAYCLEKIYEGKISSRALKTASRHLMSLKNSLICSYINEKKYVPIDDNEGMKRCKKMLFLVVKYQSCFAQNLLLVDIVDTKTFEKVTEEMFSKASMLAVCQTFLYCHELMELDRLYGLMNQATKHFLHAVFFGLDFDCTTGKLIYKPESLEFYQDLYRKDHYLYLILINHEGTVATRDPTSKALLRLSAPSGIPMPFQ